MRQECKLNALALSLIPGVGPILARQLVSYSGSISEVFSISKSKLRKIPGVGEKVINGIASKAYHLLAEKELYGLEKEGAGLVFITQPEYPTRLKEVNDAPVILFTKGKMDLNPLKAISIVGSRKATDYGKSVVSELVSGLKDHKASIISGLAYGIDIHAHKEAIRLGLQTIAVTGSGLDIVYPAAHKKYLNDMYRNGGIISEFPLGTKPEAYNFPARNRIIAAMTDATIVIEASNNGGALITAEIANSYNKDVFAVPGQIGDKYSEGCHKLIKAFKANLITSIEDLEYILGWDDNDPSSNTQVLIIDEKLSVEEKKVINLLRENTELIIDEISWRTELPINQIASILLNLEFMGYVNNLPGKKFKLVRNVRR